MFFDFQDDAERLLKNCNRYDLLNDFYQSSGQWGKVGNDSSCNLYFTTGAVENIQRSSWVFFKRDPFCAQNIVFITIWKFS